MFSLASLLAPTRLRAHGVCTDTYGCHKESSTGLSYCHSVTFSGQPQFKGCNAGSPGSTPNTLTNPKLDRSETAVPYDLNKSLLNNVFNSQF